MSEDKRTSWGKAYVKGDDAAYDLKEDKTNRRYPARMRTQFGSDRDLSRPLTSEGWTSKADEREARKQVSVEQLKDGMWKICSTIGCTVVATAGLIAAIAAATAGAAGGKRRTMKRRRSRRKSKTRRVR
jgi:hypothetical protein